uniref:Reverse transcriptase zinc-binding domain-containing protein n=1 Tax=Tanacetum cinerariifolium TaxID=118510 RepID=A0A699IND0_TANCI|nr:hypothetical protein [Tanacetum cinerariifolium]
MGDYVPDTYNDNFINKSTTNKPDVNFNPDTNSTVATDKSISNENEHFGNEKASDEKSSNVAKPNDGDSVDTTSKPPGFNRDSAHGNSGGILTIWDLAIFSCTTTLVTDNVLIVEVLHLSSRLVEVLEQGDPLSLFLFIIGMEGLHAAIEDVISSTLFRGLSIGSQEFSNWKLRDWLRGRDVVLRLFFLPISGSLSGNWKVTMLSSGGLLTLIKSVIGSLGIYYMSLFKAPIKGHWTWQWRRNLRDGEEGSQLAALLETLNQLTLDSNSDDWIWEADTSKKYVPSKVNIFAWRLLLNRLPTRINIMERGIDIPSILFPVCNSQQEDVDHLFVHCEVASQIWH